ncbi:MAG: hypothetical protein KGN00_10305 [Chloroflexota bacterium]|nr:hypothetical protein [Chloroflexota bacterium]
MTLRAWDPPTSALLRVPTTSGRGRRNVLGLLVLAALIIGCTVDQGRERHEAEATFDTFLRDLTTGQYAGAVGVMRSADGKPLDARTRDELVRYWDDHLRVGQIRITDIEYVSEEPLTPEVLQAIGADEGLQLVINTSGSSTDPCWKVPVQYAVGRVARIGGRWYVVTDPANYFFPCPSRTPSLP